MSLDGLYSHPQIIFKFQANDKVITSHLTLCILQLLGAYLLIPPGEALVLSPLAAGKIDPDTVLVYANPAQIMMLPCALHFNKFERFQFSFMEEGARSDELAQCYLSGKHSLAIPCFDEIAFGSVTDDEMIIMLPPVHLDEDNKRA
jgi:hypothetical protein